jgi:hypothetical protein
MGSLWGVPCRWTDASPWARRAEVLAWTIAGVSTVASGLPGCGGTTGRSDSAALVSADSATDPKGDPIDGQTADATTAMPVGDAGLDATLHPDADEGLFDVIIPYVDRMLLNIQPPAVDGGAESGGINWPNCPPDTTDPSSALGIPIPAEYNDAGHIVAAPDGSVCATYPWMGRLDWTNCTRAQLSTTSGGTIITFPPCSVLPSGPEKASTGTGAGRLVTDLCKDLWECMVSTGCGLSPTFNEFCLCGTVNIGCNMLDGTQDAGPCKDKMLAAMQIDPSTKGAMATADMQFFNVGNQPFATAATLNQLWVTGTSGTCYTYDDGGAP